MHEDGAGLVLSPTDLTKHLACPHITTLDLSVARGDLAKPEIEDEALELIFRLGLEHEANYLERLEASNLSVEKISDQDDLQERVRATEAAMRRGVDVIYQATFLHDGWRGHADFLIRVERPSNLGDYSYDVADTKLARRMKVPALLQMAEYGRHLERIQGVPPEWMTVVTGDGEERTFRYDDAAAYTERAIAQLRDAVENPQPTIAEPVGHCSQCRWSSHCEAKWRRDDHLSLVAFMRGDHRRELESVGITTVAKLASADPAALPKTIGESSRIRLQAQAALQIKERKTGTPHYELLDPQDGLGLLRLPERSDGDVYLDFEGDPYAEGGEGREYLAGLWDRDGNFTTYWAHSADEERELTRDLLRDLTKRLDAHPDMHIYHYAPYERTALARLTQRHDVGVLEFDRLLRGETLVDLYGVVRQGLRISKGSYSIKKLEAFYWGGVRGSGDQPDDVADALSSVVAYEKWLVGPDQPILDSIAAYNRDDVRSTHDLHEWLEARRSELEGRHGPFPRPTIPTGTPSVEQTEAEAREAELAARLVENDLPLLAGLVGWHRRESKPGWWDHFRVADLTDDELVEDSAALGEVGPPVEVGQVKRSTIWRYEFPPQDTKVRDDAVDVHTHKSVGTIVAIDASEGWVDVRLGNTKAPTHSRGFGPAAPIGVAVLQKSIARTANDVLDGRITLGEHLLDRVVPDNLLGVSGETPTERAVRVARSMSGSVLAIQGPPGTGKTYTGAALIRALLDDGKKVGVCAQSHAVIGNLLKEINRPALQRCGEGDHCGSDIVDQADANPEVLDALQSGRHSLVGGTAWLWSREEFVGEIDVLVIDEAGQFSLANAVAVSSSATSLVLLGDQQQLASPSQAVHPDGAGVSALEHLLQGDATIAADRGVFLDKSYRMHPAVASVVSDLMYEGRLQSAPDRERQALVAPEPWGGAGVRWVPVAHEGNEAASTEEAKVVAGIVSSLIGQSWIDCEEKEHLVGLDDILIVAPYNAHVARLRSAIPGARIGTVDKFQGQEAPVAIYSMASSSVEDAPRGVSFLYDLHRLNVAISRARCVAIVVGSPRLLDAAVNKPDDLRSVNGLIKSVNSADAVVV